MKATIGRTVHFVPPQDCVGPKSLTLYPAIITQVNPGAPVAGDYGGADESVELVTFGPNSVYFQHGVPFSEELKSGHWSWPAKV
jgi:hypothetical protein